MNLTENEKRLAYQVESTDQIGTLHELAMMNRYATKLETNEASESLLRKLRTLSADECMAVVNDVQKNYRLPEKPQTIGEMLAEARQKSGAERLAGHDIMALERFAPDTRHMIVFDVISHESPVGNKGERMRLFLTEQGYQKSLENQDKAISRSRTMQKSWEATSTMTARTEPCKNASKEVGNQPFSPLCSVLPKAAGCFILPPLTETLHEEKSRENNTF